MTTMSHWGHWVDSEEPITGVYSIHSVAFEFIDDEICIDCLEAEEAVQDEVGRNYYDEKDIEYEIQAGIDEITCDSSHTKLIGDWIEYTGPDLEKHKDECFFIVAGTGYAPNKVAGEFAAIERETTIQVVWSKTTERHGLCSPCYPGQADMDSVGEFLCYSLPEYLLYKEE